MSGESSRPMSPVVSVVIPTYNRAAFLLETLASVFAQSFTDYEVIVVNDGSPDDTAERLRPFAEAGRIVYREQRNAGQSTARNRGFAEARGEFIAFLDDDDLWPPDKLAWQVAALREHPDWGLVSGLAALMDADGTRREPDEATGEVQLQSIDAIFEGCGILSPGQVLIRRAALEAAGGFDPTLYGCEDTDLWIRVAARGPAALVRRTALHYRLHATNATRAAGRMFWDSVRTVRKNLPLVPRARRADTRRRALRNIYVYAGTRVVGAARAEGLRAGGRALQVLAYLLPSILGDAELALLVGRDLLPARVRRWWRASRPLPAP